MGASRLGSRPNHYAVTLTSSTKLRFMLNGVADRKIGKRHARLGYSETPKRLTAFLRRTYSQTYENWRWLLQKVRHWGEPREHAAIITPEWIAERGIDDLGEMTDEQIYHLALQAAEQEVLRDLREYYPGVPPHAEDAVLSEFRSHVPLGWDPLPDSLIEAVENARVAVLP